jgi:two-component system, chemotaxis family, sensor kinase CheA
MRRVRIGLLPRLFGSYLLVALLSLGIAGLLVSRTVRDAGFAQVEERLSYEVTMTGQMMASALFAPLAPGDSSLQAPITELSNAVNTHLSLLTGEGVVVADSEQTDIASLPPKVARPDVARALQQGRGSAISSDEGCERLWVSERISRDGQVLGVARASVPTTVIEERVDAVEGQLRLAAWIALGLGIATALGLSLSIVRPVRRVAEAAQNIGKGQLGTRVAVSTNDEIGDLGKTLNEMASKLESMVNDLGRRNADMRRVLDTVDQGLVMVAPDGTLSDERSARVSDWFGAAPSGARIWEVFADAPRERDSLAVGWSQLVDAALPLEVLIDQLPRRITHGGRSFELDYRAVSSAPEVLESVLVVATDVTERVEAEKREALQKDVLRVVERATTDRMGVLEFLGEADQIVTEVAAPESDVQSVRRGVHTLKGNCGMHGLTSIAQLCHEIENHLDEHGSFDQADLRLLVARWEDLRERVRPVLGSPDTIHLHRSVITSAVEALLSGEKRGRFAERLISWLLPSVDTAVERLAEQASALAERLGKGQIEVHRDTDGTPLPGELWPAFWAGMTHAVRNAIDHGLEPPDERAARGKSPFGSIEIRAKMTGAELVVALRDDGRGINWPAVAERLRRAGYPAESREQLVEGLFLDGISTAERTTTVSGRGVGMSALRSCVEDLGGRIEIDSNPGAGTTLTCRFPREAAGDSEWAERIRRLPATSQFDLRARASQRPQIEVRPRE